MKEMIIGVSVLLGIVLFQWSMQRLKQWRLHRAWTEAMAALEAEDLDTARQRLERCVAIAPLWLHGRVWLGIVLGLMGDSGAAEEALKNARDLHPKEAEPYFGLGMLYATVLEGRDEEAIGAFAEAVECDGKVRETLAVDPRLERLRGDARFRVLLGEAGES